MRYANHRFECVFEQLALLPAYKGSTLRGVFGRALKSVVCALKRQECPDCLLRTECFYPRVFEPALICSTPAAPVPPHPFVLRSPLDNRTSFGPGDRFDFNMILLGDANTRLPYFIYALERMGSIGLGKKIDGRRGVFRLERVRTGDQTVYTRDKGKLVCDRPWNELQLGSSSPFAPSVKKLTLNFLTPLRLKHQNRFATELPFHVVVRAMLRRAATLLAHFGEGEPSLDYSGLVRRAETVQVQQNDLRWEDWQRYSLRQDQAMQLGGLTGRITYTGNLDEYLPLVEFCASVHIGKQTTFGLGRFEMEAAV